MSRLRKSAANLAWEAEWPLPVFDFGGFFISFEKVTTGPKSRQTKMPQAKAPNWSWTPSRSL